jgi:hypothetical protein
MSKTRIRVCVPYPNHGRISDECLRSIDELLKVDSLEVAVHKVQTTSIGLGRNSGINMGASSAVRQGGWDWDYYLSLDADIGFKAEDVLKLLSSGKDIISGAYQYRCDINKMVAGTLNKHGVCEHGTYLDWAETGIRKVDWAGSGFVLIKREVFEAIDYPWYQEGVTTYTDDQGVVQACYVSDDIVFFTKAIKAGFEVYVDCDCKVAHLINFNPMSGDVSLASIGIDFNQIQAEMNRVAGLIAEKQKEVEQLNLLRVELNGQLLYAQTLIQRINSQPKPDAQTPSAADGAPS